MSVVFAAISPHPPILLPSIGSADDRLQVKKTIESLELLSKEFEEAKPDTVVISSPHPDWGFNVPLFFIAKEFKGEAITYLTGAEAPEFYLNEGKKFFRDLDENKKYALIASGDLSHCLKEEGPYGFNPDGPKFDKDLIEFLKKKNTDNILRLDNKYPEAGECGLRSFCFILGILEVSGINYQPEILSYECPFGVGYLVVDLKL